MKKKEYEAGKISVIIPVYNAHYYIDDCLNSILNQTYKNYEIIIVNDGSTDDSKEIIEEYTKKYNNITFINNTNHGQGYSRNRALEKAKGEYVMFIDADDFIDHRTFEMCIEKTKEDNYDVIAFDWQYYQTKSENCIYNHYDVVYAEEVLLGKKNIRLLEIKNYFTVNKMYNHKFLKDNDIVYGEGFIYEDVPFWLKVSTSANKTAFIGQPLYYVRINQTSTTKTNHKTDKHYKSFIDAVKACLDIVKNSNYKESDFNYLYEYLIGKFFLYKNNRVPFKYKASFAKEFLKEMSTVDIKPNDSKSGMLKLCCKLKVIKRRDRFLLNLLNYANLIKKKLREKVRKYRNKQNAKKSITNYDFKDINSIGKIVVFMGFDYRYTGNSRYLYEDMLSKYKRSNLFFVTTNKLVDEKHRVEPKSDRMYALLQAAKIVIFESWIPKDIKKFNNQVWIQLWHGTPLKKMFFDSGEKDIIEKNKKHKITKYNDLKRWDYLVSDSPACERYLTVPFYYPNENVLRTGYPRVKYLIDNINNEQLKKQIKKQYNIDLKKKVVAYLPTWRDYNYNGKVDKNYLLNIESLQSKLGDDYLVISKEHSFLNSNKNLTDIETQELLLISDFLITDYSSVMFDAFAIDINVVLFVNDFEKYQKSRGVYLDIWKDIKDLSVDNEDDLAKRIKENFVAKNYNSIKEKYSYKNECGEELSDIIYKMIEKRR